MIDMLNYLEYLETASLQDKLDILKKKWFEVAKRFPNIYKGKYEEVEPRLEKVWGYIVLADPTKNKQYLQWILQKGISDWTNKNERLMKEDLPKIKEDLNKYTLLKVKNKLKPEHKDINRFKTYNELLDILDTYTDTKSNRDKDKELEQSFFDNKQAILVANTPTWKIVIPKTKNASCYFGVNTKWCTAAKEDNAFNEYNRIGSLYIILHKPTNKRWQFHLLEDQFMNERDEEVDFDKFNKQYPEVFGQLIKFSDKEIAKAIKFNYEYLRYISNIPLNIFKSYINRQDITFVTPYLNNPSKELLKYIADSGLDGFLSLFDTKNVTLFTNDELNRMAIEAVTKEIKSTPKSKFRKSKYNVTSNDTNEILTGMKRIKYKPSDELLLLLLDVDSRSIRYFPNNISNEVKEAVLKTDAGSKIRFIKNPTEQEQIKAVKEDPQAIKYLINPTEKVHLIAFKKDPNFYIHNIKNIPPSIRNAIINRKRKYFYTLSVIKDPTEAELQTILANDPKEILWFKDKDKRLTSEMWRTAIDKMSLSTIQEYLYRFPPETYDELLKRDLKFFKHLVYRNNFKLSSEEIKRALIKKDVLNILFIPEINLELVKFAIKDSKNREILMSEVEIYSDRFLTRYSTSEFITKVRNAKFIAKQIKDHNL